ncbi:5999_t:CDS:2 [Ambispora leptoticha]|uniref:5999_t:CDS:1 n=1 Tax=Ambispora leptoticha TaxID=144679 RepID=A0A9N9A4K7_9GLOM|nr:5999_t:CDS:2 [Ambispora leptoticha]
MNFTSLLGNNTEQILSSEIISKTHEVLEAYEIARDVYKQAGKALRNAATKVEELGQLLPEDMCIQLPKELLYGLPSTSSSKKSSVQTLSSHKSHATFSLPSVRKRGRKLRRHRRHLVKKIRTQIIESEDEFNDSTSDYNKDSSSNEMGNSKEIILLSDLEYIDDSEEKSESSRSEKLQSNRVPSKTKELEEISPIIGTTIDSKTNESKKGILEPPASNFTTPDLRSDYGLNSKSPELPKWDHMTDKTDEPNRSIDSRLSPISENSFHTSPKMKNASHNDVKKKSESMTSESSVLTNKMNHRYDPYPTPRQQSFESTTSTVSSSMATSGQHATLHSFFLNGLPHQSSDASNWFQEVTKHTYTPQPLSAEDNTLINEFIKYAAPRLKNPRCTQSEIAREIILLSNNTCKMSQGSVSTMMRRISVPKPATTRRAIQNWINNERAKKEHQEKMNLMWKTTNNNWK